MNKLVTDDPQTNTEVMLNLAYVKDKEVWIRGGGPDGEDCTLIDFSKQMCMKNHECQYDDGFPADLAKDDFDTIGDLFMECSMCGCPIGTMYFIAIQAAELRERLRTYEEKTADDTTLLKEQEAIKPQIDAFGHPYCPKCKILVYETWKFCPHCGQAIQKEAL